MSLPVEASQSTGRPPRGLGRLLASTAVSMVGQGAVAAAVPLLAATLTRDPLGVSAVAAAMYVAWLVVGLPAGALVDRWPRRQVMVSADLVRALLLGGLSVAVLADRLPLAGLVAVVFLIASAGCFFDPAAQAGIPVLAGRESAALAKANGRLWTLDVLGRSLLGPPLGAAAFAAAAVAPFALNGVTFLLSAALLLGLHGLGRPQVSTPAPRVSHAVVEGLRFLLGHAALRLLTLGMATYNLGYNIAFATLVLFAQDELHVTERGFGFMLAMLAVGGVAGGWLAPKVHERLRPVMTYSVCLAVQGLAWLAVMLGAHVAAAYAALAVVGLASTVVSVVGGTARQTLTPDHLLGRITAGTRVFGIGSAAVGSIVGGLLASLGTLATPLLGAAGLLLVASLLFALPGLRRTS